MTITIKVTDNVTPAVRKLIDLQGAKAYKVASVAMGEAVRSHFVARDLVPNKRGWPKTHFYDRARKQTHFASTASEASVSVSLVGFATHFLGKPEVIKPVNGKYLTLPAIPQAYGRRAREFSDLVFRMVPDMQGGSRPALVRAQQTVFSLGRRRKDGTRSIKNPIEVGGEVYFWLVRSVKPKPHPEAFPTDQVLQEAIVRELNAFVESL